MEEEGLYFIHAYVMGRFSYFPIGASAERYVMAHREGEGVVKGNGRDRAAIEVEALVFSKDRPYQLHGLLTSLQRHATNLHRAVVIYHASTECTAEAYARLTRSFPDAAFIDDGPRGFRYTVEETLLALNSSHVVPMVDELVWTRSVDFAWYAAALEKLSPRGSVQLRLGENLSLFSTLLRKFGDRFIVSSSPKLLMYDSSLTCMSFCDDDGTVHLNDFWFVESGPPPSPPDNPVVALKLFLPPKKEKTLCPHHQSVTLSPSSAYTHTRGAPPGP